MLPGLSSLYLTKIISTKSFVSLTDPFIIKRHIEIWEILLVSSKVALDGQLFFTCNSTHSEHSVP